MYITGDDGVTRKFACQTCIKGHRSTKCTHSDRKLVEIKRKGRPVTQCAECRQLRKTKQMHVKCICNPKRKVFNFHQISPAAPTALPAAGASPAMQLETNSDLRIEPVAQFCPRCDNPTANCKCVQALNHATESENTSPSSIEDASTPGSNASSSIERNFLPASNTSSPSSSTGSMPPFPVAYPAISEIRSTATARRATPPIPIHDPTDDIDSDTPIYKSEEHMVPDRTAVLGELSHTSSEDLMKQIYGGFSCRNSREDCDSPGESAEIKLEPKCGCSCHECINTVCQDCAETVCQEVYSPL
ncbi:hypothetical protein VTP01DRAFT_9956 [Rhizomucor pusillus]|uniref:uncharacterized protein n=1 Tax=Rhizomucor pusillus TaxID=4840 RepID=UPI00374331D8